MLRSVKINIGLNSLKQNAFFANKFTFFDNKEWRIIINTCRSPNKTSNGGCTWSPPAREPPKEAPIILPAIRSEEHTSELQSLMRISYAVFCLKKKKTQISTQQNNMKLK